MLESLDIQVIVTGIVGMITTITGSFVSWMFAKKKYNAEVDNSVIQNMQNSLEFYKQLSDDNRQRLDEVLKRNDQLQDEISQLRCQVLELMNNVCYRMSCELRMRIPKETNRERKVIKVTKDNVTEIKENKKNNK